MPTPAPVQFTTGDGSLTGAVSGTNTQFAFVPLPKLFLYQVRLDQRGHLLFHNGLLVNEYADYAAGFTAGTGWFLLTEPV